MHLPLVTVICLCYNHASYLAEALDSVLAQTYPNIEIIVMDDASTDDSVALIQDYCKRFPHIKFLQNFKNQGSCTAFNQAFFQSTGEYIVDFATDDVLMPTRLEEQVACFASLPEDYGVVYTDALLIDEFSRPIRNFYQTLPNGKLKPEPVSGWIYADLVKKYFVSTPTMMTKRKVLEKLNGYNENLAYEDFDFWVRSGRLFRYQFLPKVLTKRRLHPQQLSRKLYKRHDKQLASTVKVCQTALELNQTEVERQALIFRVHYEFKKAVSTANFSEALQLPQILDQLKALTGIYKLTAIVIKWQLYLVSFAKNSLRDMNIVRYHSGLQAQWNTFNAQAVNGTFFFDRNFIEYHGSRFIDHSLLFFFKHKLMALLPLHEDRERVASHQGLSFGGFIVSAKVETFLVLQIFENLKKYLLEQGFATLIYKPQPYVYLSQPGQDDLFALSQFNAELSQRNLMAVLDITQPLQYSKLRQRCLKRAKEHHLVVRLSDDIENYMKLVQEVYDQAGISAPTHAVQELKYLMQAFPENIELLAAYDNDVLLGGVLLFKHRQVINFQYIATTPIGRQKHALDLLVNTVINQYKNKAKYLSFGTSHDNRQLYQLRHTLVQNKNSYGARGVVQDTYQIHF